MTFPSQEAEHGLTSQQLLTSRTCLSLTPNDGLSAISNNEPQYSSKPTLVFQMTQVIGQPGNILNHLGPKRILKASV